MTEVRQTAEALADELIEIEFEAEPLTPTLYGLPGSHDRLADLSEEAEQRTREKLAVIADRARALNTNGTSTDGRITAKVVAAQAEAGIDRIDSRAVEYTVTDLMIAPASGLLTNLPMIRPRDADAAFAYLDRLAAIPDYLATALVRHQAGIASGRTPVRHLVQAAVDHLDRYLGGTEPLATPQAPEGATGFEERREQVIVETVRPAFAHYRDALTADVLPHGRQQDRPGLCWIPGGDEYYTALVRSHTTTTRTPQELHDTGLELIAALSEEYRELGARVFGESEPAAIFARLRSDPALRWKDEAEVLDTARTAITTAQREAPRWFSRLPEQPCVVEAVPPADAPGAPPAYYQPPAFDGSRPGTYYVNTYAVDKRFRYVAESIAFHEAVPGHHFQLSIAQELADLPLLRKIGRFNAYVEGWGLYSERLAGEMGLYSDDVARLGMLATDSMRAGRLVVDTGLHALGWSRQQAVDYLTENTPMAPVEISSEVDRYIAFAGQALSYMVGRLEIQRLRSLAETTLADRFDIRGFHDLILGSGALPLSVLTDVVEDWVSSS